MSMPEGFEADEDGTFHGVPDFCMRAANQLMGSVIGKREWDVPMIAAALWTFWKEGVNESKTL